MFWEVREKVDNQNWKEKDEMSREGNKVRTNIKLFKLQNYATKIGNAATILEPPPIMIAQSKWNQAQK